MAYNASLLLVQLSYIFYQELNSVHISILEHIDYVVKMSVSGYSKRRFKHRLHHFTVSYSMIFNPHCFIRLSCEISTGREHPSGGCLFSAMSFREEISLRRHRINVFSLNQYFMMLMLQVQMM